ncbi:hypothetical protein HWN40_05880 [Methanolobus zinderi]|jgi:hypothetical protein|uniref:Uncharacterized protein n=1 Tax=Methanolobus zinderi TaxID=536044 RepID=A0A7D5IPD2_9EURY|nr:hypothetical protein [Methanolobus zinderi]QLC49807.1 hypothetical protein HWN40_05880 [Methanolobus zinderi]
MSDNEELTDEELEELLEEHSKLKEKPKHRGYGDYERRRIYRGPSVKRDEKKESDPS